MAGHACGYRILFRSEKATSPCLGIILRFVRLCQSLTSLGKSMTATVGQRRRLACLQPSPHFTCLVSGEFSVPVFIHKRVCLCSIQQRALQSNFGPLFSNEVAFTEPIDVLFISTLWPPPCLIPCHSPITWEIHRDESVGELLEFISQLF